MKKRNRNKWAIGGGVIAAAIIGASFLAINENSVYFYTPSEAKAQAGSLGDQTIKVGGMVLPGSQIWTPESLDLKFTLSDLKGSEIRVEHKGTPPDMFKEGSGVIVEGRIDSTGGLITSRNLMVKHSEEYKAPHNGESMDKKLIQESMFKNEKANGQQ
jgi:cytochrome c-type biogenesis protein CcmE